MSCPVDHTKLPAGSQCPVSGQKAPSQQNENTDEKVEKVEKDEDDEYALDISEPPSVQEYRGLKRQMSMISEFYRKGSELKGRNRDAMIAEIAKLDLDARMVAAQIAALNENTVFRGHPKRRDLLSQLKSEAAALVTRRGELQAKLDNYVQVHKWSLGVVDCCEWLEKNLDAYCAQFLDLPQKIKAKIQPVPELSPELIKNYSLALDEIIYNLHESQDFFKASIDGRLDRFQDIEKQILLAQLDAIRQFPEDNERRQYVESELQQDLEYVQEKQEAGSSEQSMEKRRKMLDNHSDFFKVLRYQRDTLGLLNLDDKLRAERQYDSQFDLIATANDLNDE